MKHAACLFVAVLGFCTFGAGLLGAPAMREVAQGAIAIMALLISATFLWLWHERTTPLALGMSLSWSGLGLTLGGGWVNRVLETPEWSLQAAAVFVSLSLLISGAVMHFAVIQTSFGLRGLSFLLPVGAAFLLSLGVLLAL